MNKISIKAVIVGGLVDIISTNVFELPLMVYMIFVLLKSGVPQDQVHEALMESFQSNSLLYASGMVIGIFCSVLGGYVSARIAKHDEVLNGALASFLCVSIGLYSLTTSLGSSDIPLWQHLVSLVLSPIVAGFGGYLRLLQTNKQGVA